jgi:carbon monoxide dehydrogenase subunit G
VVFEGKLILAASASQVWDFLLDVDRFSSCVPGVQQVEKLDDHNFAGTLAASVGPISGSFAFRASIVESRPPDEMSARLEGTDSVTKSKVYGDIKIRLNEVQTKQTQLGYHASVDIEGRLAILGDMIMRATATLSLEEFIRRLRAQVETESGQS